jgi:hypothetical protein
MTAAINPAPGLVQLAVTDPALRRRQYVGALSYLLGRRVREVQGVVFVENSGADLSELRDVAARHPTPVEFIPLALNDYPPNLGKGYGEFRMLDEAVASSKLLASAEYLVKLTGRLGVANLSSIIRRLPPGYDVAADIIPEVAPEYGFVASRLLFLRTDVYRRHVTGAYRKVDDSRRVHAENVLYYVLRDNPHLAVVPLLPREPRWRGMAGTTGVAYDSLGMRLKHPYKVVRRAIRLARGDGRLIRGAP